MAWKTALCLRSRSILGTEGAGVDGAHRSLPLGSRSSAGAEARRPPCLAVAAQLLGRVCAHREVRATARRMEVTVCVTGAGPGNHGQADRLPPTLLRSSLPAASRLDGSGGGKGLEVLAPGGLTVRWLWRWERASRQRAWLKQRREEEVRVSSPSGGTIQSLWMSPTALRPSGLATNLSFLFPVGCSAPCTRYLREGSWGITLWARPLRLLGPPDSPTHICHLSVALLTVPD